MCPYVNIHINTHMEGTRRMAEAKNNAGMYLCMFLRKCTHKYTHGRNAKIHTCPPANLSEIENTYIYTYTYIYIYTTQHTRAYIQARLPTYPKLKNTCICLYVYIYIHTHIHAQSQIRTCIHTGPPANLSEIEKYTESWKLPIYDGENVEDFIGEGKHARELCEAEDRLVKEVEDPDPDVKKEEVRFMCVCVCICTRMDRFVKEVEDPDPDEERGSTIYIYTYMYIYVDRVVKETDPVIIKDQVRFRYIHIYICIYIHILL
jgi:hypothetical protein